MPNPDFDLRTMKLVFSMIEEDDDRGYYEDLVEVPAKFVICVTCRGRGKHSRAVDGHGITQEEWDRDWSPEERDMYEAGMYDRECEDCNGSGKCTEPDWDKISPEDAKRIREWYKEEAEYAAEIAAERRMGA